MNFVKLVLQNVVGLGLGKYVNLGLLVAAVVAAFSAYTYVKTTENTIASLESANSALRLAVASDERVIARITEDADKKVAILTELYRAGLDDKLTIERAMNDIDAFNHEATSGTAKPDELESTLNRWQGDFDECMEAASGGPPAKPGNKVC